MEQIAAISSPSDTDFNKVLEWLKSSGVLHSKQIRWNRYKDMIFVNGPVEDLEVVLGTQLNWYGSVDENAAKMFLRASGPLQVPPEIEPLIAFISVNCPILGNDQVKPKINSSPYPPKGYLKVWGTGDGALVRLSFYCWNSTMATQTCDRSFTPLAVHVQVKDVQANYPSQHYEIPFETLDCSHKNKTGSNRLPCDPRNSSAAHYDCQCALLIGPLPLYRQLEFHAYVALETESGLVENSFIGKTPPELAPVFLEFTTPHLLRQIYNLPNTPIKNGASMATAEFRESFDQDDMDLFMKMMGLPKVEIPNKEVIGNFPITPSQPGGEALLDIQYMLAMAPNATFGYYSLADCYPFCSDEDYLLWLFYIGTQEKPEHVHSLSYGSHEPDTIDATEPGALEMYERVEYEFVKLGLIGCTVVVSSGDNGVCESMDPTNPEHGCKKTTPNWPTTSPYITAVGATQLSDQYSPVCGSRWSSFFNLSIPCSGSAEIACMSDQGCVITTGGSFSVKHSRPWYQETAVSRYLENFSSAKGFPTDPDFFNKDGRAYPDVAFFGSSYSTIMDDGLIEFCGTSASTPLFAAFVTILNDRLLGEGLPTVGFMNPLIYYLFETRPEIFNDVVIGNNACRVGQRMGSTPLDCNEQYFSAAPGWDPVTGFGSMNMDLLAKAIIDIHKEKANQRLQKAQGLDQNKALFPYVLPMMTIKPSTTLFPYVLPMILALSALIISMRTVQTVNRHSVPSRN